MKINKRFIFLILACIFVLISIYFISQIYAKYLTSVDGAASIPISRWNIKVNDQQIRNNADISQVITPIFPGNDYISANIIAPTAEGYFDLMLDFTDTDVSFKYDILTVTAENSAVTDLVVSGYSVDDGEIIPIQDSAIPVSKNILLSDNIKTQKVRIYVVWNDDTNTSNMDNLADTTSANLEDNTAKFNVNVSFTQIIESSQKEP